MNTEKYKIYQKPREKGGQQAVGIREPIILETIDSRLKIECNIFRSQHKNKQLLETIYELLKEDIENGR